MTGNVPLLSWLAGLALIFVGERFFGLGHELRMPTGAFGGALLLLAVGLRFKQWLGAAGETKKVLGGLLPAYLVGSFGLDLYGVMVWSPEFAAGDDAQLVLNVLWPIFLVCGTLPIIAMEFSLRSMVGAARLEVRRVFEAGHAGLAIALALSWLFALNWVASEKNDRIDMRTVSNIAPSGMTMEMARNLDEDVTITLFFPPANDVLDLIEPYFEDLGAASTHLTVQRLDRDMHPAQAKEMRARKNGVVILTKGDDHEQVRLDVDAKKARSKLKKLDDNVQQKLSKVSREQRVAYIVTGHGERSVSPKAEDPGGMGSGVKGVKEILKQLNYKVKKLGLKDGLAEDVPDDATVVLVLGPRTPMLDEELSSLIRYVQTGGSLMLMVDPDTEDEDLELGPLLEVLGVDVNLTMLVNESKHVALRGGGLVARAFLNTNRFTAHDSTKLLSKLSTRGDMVFPQTGSLGIRSGPDESDVTFTVRSLAGTFRDENDNRTFDKGSEKKEVFNLVAAVELPKAEGADLAGRAVVTADADIVTDMLFARLQMNQNWFAESIFWLANEELSGGEVADLEDVPIVHTGDEDKVWFYGTTLGVPLLVLGMGFGVTRRRRKTA